MATRPKNDKMGSIMGPAPKLTPKPMPKKKAQGGPTGKSAPKYDANGKRILSGTCSTTSNQRMPELKKPGGISGAAAKPKATPNPSPKATPKVKIPSMISSAKPKPKYTQLPRKTR
jgi:hypothetical protein